MGHPPGGLWLSQLQAATRFIDPFSRVLNRKTQIKKIALSPETSEERLGVGTMGNMARCVVCDRQASVTLGAATRQL
jgi:hypothetical protein